MVFTNQDSQRRKFSLHMTIVFLFSPFSISTKKTRKYFLVTYLIYPQTEDDVCTPADFVLGGWWRRTENAADLKCER